MRKKPYVVVCINKSRSTVDQFRQCKDMPSEKSAKK